MTDLQILKQALFEMNIGYENISDESIEITNETEPRMEYNYGNTITFEFDKNGKLKSILATGE